MKLLKYISSQIITFFSFFCHHPPPHIHFELCCCFQDIILFMFFFLFAGPISIMARKFLVELWSVSLQASGHTYIYIRQAKHSNKINVEAYVIDFYFIYFLQTDVFHGNLILIGGVAMFFDCFLLKRWFLFSSSRSRNVYIKNMSVLLELSQTQQFV